jgi:hypothetical protein
MTQQELDREVAHATGESLSTICRMGFTPLTHGPVEIDRQPQVVDWDRLDANRYSLFPARRRTRA